MQNPFVDGSIPFGSSTNGIVDATPLDFLHGWCGGIAKTVISCVIAIILNHSSSKYPEVFECIKQRMCNMPRFPVAPGFSRVQFKDGKLIVFKMCLTCL